MKLFLYSLAAVMFLDGIWTHDWRMILAAVSVAAIWPLISGDIEGVAHEDELDRLWDDEAAA